MKTLIIFLTIIQVAFGAKILGIFPTPSISHQVVFRALMKDLAERGHELLILTPDPFDTDNSNVTQINLHSSYEIIRSEFNFTKFAIGNLDETDLFNFFFPIMMHYFEEQINHPKVKKLIEEKEKYHFDLIIMEVLMNYPMLGFAEIFDAPVIEFTSLDTVNENHKLMGNEVNPVVYPEIMFPFQQRRPTFKERWNIIKYSIKSYFSRSSQEKVMKDFISKYFSINEPDLDKMRERIELLMTNTHPALGYIRPILPNTIQLGFMHIEPPKPISDGPLKIFLDNSKHGVIYMSLGSNVQSKDLNVETLKIFTNTFSRLKYDVLWKFENDNLQNVPKNVMIQKWFPQADLLAHPKIKIFITQGGQQSMEEAIDRAVPTVVIPFLGDQGANALKMEQKKIGKSLDLITLTEAKLESTITEMMKPQYKENIKKLRDLIYDQPMSSREKAVWWTEYVIRHKGIKHIKHIGKNIPFYEKYFLDFAVLAIIGVVILAVAFSHFWSVISRSIAAKTKTQ